jgi:hypothetical protein
MQRESISFIKKGALTLDVYCYTIHEACTLRAC